MSSSRNQSSGTRGPTRLGTAKIDPNSMQPNETLLSLLDGASSQRPFIATELETQRRVAADTSRPLPERLEAYEDIMDSEVGDTHLVRARNVEREMGLRQIYLKFEGGNPTGTQKDRIAFAQVMDAMRRGFEAITVQWPACNVSFTSPMDTTPGGCRR